jgi:hypothetical protein
MADPLITKQAAARRQIDTAIRMLFLHGEDFTAIHTVAAAARSILNDLAEARGVGDTYETRRALEDIYRNDYRLDLTDPAVAGEINWKAHAIEKDRRTKKLRNNSANFLKHADRDSGDALDIGELNPCQVIIECLALWNNLHLDISMDMWIYSVWWSGVTATTPEYVVNTKSGPIHLLTFDQQLDFGRYLLKRVYKDEGRSTERFRDDATHRLVLARRYCALE